MIIFYKKIAHKNSSTETTLIDCCNYNKTYQLARLTLNNYTATNPKRGNLYNKDS